MVELKSDDGAWKVEGKEKSIGREWAIKAFPPYSHES